MADARSAGLPGISSFAKGLEQDLDAVTNGLTMPWSSGPVERPRKSHQNGQKANVPTGRAWCLGSGTRPCVPGFGGWRRVGRGGCATSRSLRPRPLTGYWSCSE